MTGERDKAMGRVENLDAFSIRDALADLTAALAAEPDDLESYEEQRARVVSVLRDYGLTPR